ncbi:UDP-N-acetylmuramoyl-L-alanyl-D-glutamate--2,6-diaminopimelate ligase [Halalkalibacillus sediminis]|uniref:UDP-N-acetylmuramyl-tripeptide synthetase n=1 Tax=Halalkalibacillus sediminis TaxID=2018042 RepID=A0A2I0QSK8_9BACI|nr:UDP-N-acetylmuramoyl-L-alanyl-D-glutamate--2,6-diaminopimelate ligase [Halalkalibacillus sediminis]PKR77321.1 UDP-N-acetylmuramoyl-L-alanyl-D-glutamate--2,6-diaminopimelate ligase [Halalkalibacillus sediminis]
MNIHFTSLEQLNISNIWGPREQDVSDLSFHSDRIDPPSIFFCIKGSTEDGHKYILDAIQKGAKVIVGTNEKVLEQSSSLHPDLTFISVKNIRQTMAIIAKYMYKKPDESLKTIGITGTNGKTTVAAYVRSLLSLLGIRTGSIGTTGIWSDNQKLPYKKSTPTTPESLDIFRICRQLSDLKNDAVAMEVSSIALDQYRVEGIDFDVAIHTNFSEEHLEYHKTIEHYRDCKLRLFKQAKTAVVNIDDDGMADEILETYTGPLITYSLESDTDADLFASKVNVDEDGSYFDLTYQNQTYELFVPVFGDYNVANVLSAIGCALHLGYTMNEIIHVIGKLEGPQGRFEVISKPNNQKVILDYAHTPVALNRLIEEVKKLKYERLIVMIAGIGIRDFNKMPKMAQMIEGQADEIVVTVDHPGYHDPQEVVDQVMTGFKEPTASNIHTSLTRKEGVEKALHLSNEGDIILLTSGCINDAQIIKGKEVPHSDTDIIDDYYEKSLC